MRQRALPLTHREQWFTCPLNWAWSLFVLYTWYDCKAVFHFFTSKNIGSKFSRNRKLRGKLLGVLSRSSEKMFSTVLFKLIDMKFFYYYLKDKCSVFKIVLSCQRTTHVSVSFECWHYWCLSFAFHECANQFVRVSRLFREGTYQTDRHQTEPDSTVRSIPYHETFYNYYLQRPSYSNRLLFFSFLPFYMEVHYGLDAFMSFIFLLRIEASNLASVHVVYDCI